MLNPALAAATAGVSAWRKLMYSLIWQSVMWRPGKLRFLIGVKTRFLSGRPRPPENTAPCGEAAPIARFATSVRLRPPFPRDERCEAAVTVEHVHVHAGGQAIELLREIPRLRVKPGARLDPATVKTGYADMAVARSGT